jgi:hypothetical protein
MTWDFSKPETREAYQREVKKRMDRGLSREQAERLVAILIDYNQVKIDADR